MSQDQTSNPDAISPVVGDEAVARFTAAQRLLQENTPLDGEVDHDPGAIAEATKAILDVQAGRPNPGELDPDALKRIVQNGEDARRESDTAEGQRAAFYRKEAIDRLGFLATEAAEKAAGAGAETDHESVSA